MSLPPLPVPLNEFIPYFAKHPDLNLENAVKPYKDYENKLREIFAQDPASVVIQDKHVNVLPLLDGHQELLTIRGRNLDGESVSEKEKYVLALPKEERKSTGSPAIVKSMKEFTNNFNLFSESSLIDLDWSNVVAAGSSCVTSLLPVSALHNESKRALRQYYHEQLAPASDVDLFIYGLNEEQAVEKIKQIEKQVRDSILQETTTIRTKNAITIASAYPTRHVQIVLRLYKNLSEILTGFDVDCSCVAYDGSMVWATPRAVASYVTQINTIDLTRRSPSYESRLSKYSHRGFEVFCPELERSKIDPTIYERSFSRVMGLARLLVLEKLPLPTDRDEYLEKRRQERGRPPLPSGYRSRFKLPGNIKDRQPDDVAEWVEADDVSNYHTFTVPYGVKYNAKRIEKLLFTKDLLLNAEWNQKDRETTLHRHPAFFGSVDDVINDCCGFCPTPVNDEDLEIAEEENKIYVSGKISFIKDDPGRQAIGSFHPITDGDWTEMAYIGNTQRLCQAIVDGDLDHVEDWCGQEGADVNARDHTGRTPLQLAACCSTPEIVQCLIDQGARIVSRMADGFTALHIAAQRGNAPIIKALLEKSEANEEDEAQKAEIKKEVRRAAARASNASTVPSNETQTPEDFDDENLVEDEDSGDSDHLTDASFVKVSGDGSSVPGLPEDEDTGDADVYDVNVLAWDSPVSPLHLAIMGGHIDAIEELVNKFGADVLLPVKLIDSYYNKPKAAILTLVLAAQLSEPAATSKSLLELGASSTQADMKGVSALHSIVAMGQADVLDLLAEHDRPACTKAINFLVISRWDSDPLAHSALLSSVRAGHASVAERLLELGAQPHIPFEDLANAYHRKWDYASKDPEKVRNIFRKTFDQPIIHAVRMEMPLLAIKLLEAGAKPNSLPVSTLRWMLNQSAGRQPIQSLDGLLINLVRNKIKELRGFVEGTDSQQAPTAPGVLRDDKVYLESLEPGSYKYWLAKHDLEQAKGVLRLQRQNWEDQVELHQKKDIKGEAEKRAAVQVLIEGFVQLVDKLLEKDAKTFDEAFPELKKDHAEDVKNRLDQFRYNAVDKEPYRTVQSFLVPDLTPPYEDGYFSLFEAAWTGDVRRVKELTLGEWGEKRQALQVAVQDLRGFSPFSISFLRGHTELAKTILEIATAQYQPKGNKARFRYSIAGAESDYDEQADSDDESLQIFGELVDDDFTIDDVGALADKVKSRVSPMRLLTWKAEVWRFVADDSSKAQAKEMLMPGPVSLYVNIGKEKAESWAWFNSIYAEQGDRCRVSLIRFAIATMDMRPLQLLLALGSDLMARKEDRSARKVFEVSTSDFELALRLGYNDMVGEIIKSTGAAIPLRKLVKSSGVQFTEKPKYYQGLTVHGRKRQDWAEAGRGMTRTVTENEHPPIQSVAFQGNLGCLEYFLTDAPLRKYLEFAESHRDDEQVAALGKSRSGLRDSLKSWLGGYSCLPHLAVMSEPNESGSNPVLEFLIEHMPQLVEEKDQQGNTPLQLAFQLRRYYCAKMLIAAGANQLTKNDKAENILHTAVANVPNRASLKGVISLLDPSLVESLLLQKCGGDFPGAGTPLAQFIQHYSNSVKHEDACAMIELLLSYSGGKDLNVLNGAGDYPLQYLVRHHEVELVKLIVGHFPSTMDLENATGQTPIDVARTSYLRHQVDNPPTVIPINEWSAPYSWQTSILERSPETFVRHKDGSVASADHGNKPRAMLEMLIEIETAQKTSRKRKLISLFDANEVAKRIATIYQKRAQRQRVSRAEGHRRYDRQEFSDVDDEETPNIVSERMDEAKQFEKRDLKKFDQELLLQAGQSN